MNSPLTSLNHEYESDFEADLFCSRLHGEADLCRLVATPFWSAAAAAATSSPPSPSLLCADLDLHLKGGFSFHC